jgi:Uma2 family endonuclease
MSAPRRILWTRDQVEALQENGFLDRNRRYEIIEGEIYEMSENPPHAGAVILLREYLVSVFGGRFVGCQSAISASITDPAKNNPIPDASVLKEDISAYFTRFPGPDDLLLVAEVSDTTLRYDLRQKASLYAQAGFVEYWVVDIIGRRLVVHRQPGAEGYADVSIYTEEQQVATLARPDRPVNVADLLPTVDDDSGAKG